MNNINIQTDRLIIRPLQVTDLAALTPILTDPEIMRFIGGAYDLEGVAIQLQDWLDNYTKDGYGFMAIIDKTDNQLIGYGGFLHQTIAGKHYIELGYCLAKLYWGHGIATEAAEALKNYGMQTLEFRELISIIDPKNFASLQIAGHLGMTLLEKINIEDKLYCIYYIE